MGGARLWTELLFGRLHSKLRSKAATSTRDQVFCGAGPAAAQPAVAAVAALYGALAVSAAAAPPAAQPAVAVALAAVAQPATAVALAAAAIAQPTAAVVLATTTIAQACLRNAD